MIAVANQFQKDFVIVMEMNWMDAVCAVEIILLVLVAPMNSHATLMKAQLSLMLTRVSLIAEDVQILVHVTLIQRFIPTMAVVIMIACLAALMSWHATLVSRLQKTTTLVSTH